jgi:hypothetical protein
MTALRPLCKNLNGLVSAIEGSGASVRSSFWSHGPLLSGCDEPRTLSYQITQFGSTSPDLKPGPSIFMGHKPQLHCSAAVEAREQAEAKPFGVHPAGHVLIRRRAVPSRPAAALLEKCFSLAD